MITETLNKIDKLLRHIHNVSSNCNLLGKKLIENGEEELGRILISIGLIHDHSKFFGIEWDTLSGIENDDFCQGFEIAVMGIGFNKIIAWALVHVAQGGDFKFSIFFAVDHICISRLLQITT